MTVAKCVLTQLTIGLLLMADYTALAQQAVPDNIAIPPAPEQPVPFSHKQHLALGLPCANCHMNPRPGRDMGLPADATCTTCHMAIAADRPSIVALHAIVDSGEPIAWKRIYEIDAGITWSHKTHLDAGLQCETCHGDVRELDVMTQATAVTAMATCISCHEAHEPDAECAMCHARPPEELPGKD